jgi:hypothetical protein
VNYGETSSVAYDDDRPARADGNVEERLDELDTVLASLDEVVEGYGRRLGPILRPDTPQPADPGRDGAKLATVRQQSALADRLESASIRVRRQVAILQSQYGRLDL